MTLQNPNKNRRNALNTETIESGFLQELHFNANYDEVIKVSMNE